MRAKLAAQELVEVQHAILGGRLVGATILDALFVQRTAAFVHLAADDVVLNRGFVVGIFLRLNIVALDSRHDGSVEAVRGDARPVEP